MLTKGTKCSTQYLYMELNKYDCSFVSVPYIISPLIFYETWHPLLNFHLLNNIHWNLYTAETFATFPSQRLLCNVIKFHVVKETKEAVPYFVQDF